VPGITVDTHFHRLVRRWAWTAEEDPVKIEHAVGALIERREWTMLSHRVIFHGRRVCHARKPACGACTLARDCPAFGTGPVDPVVAAALVKGPRAAELVAAAAVDRASGEGDRAARRGSRQGAPRKRAARRRAPVEVQRLGRVARRCRCWRVARARDATETRRRCRSPLSRGPRPLRLPGGDAPESPCRAWPDGHRSGCPRSAGPRW
jgi:hypothetical protein